MSVLLIFNIILVQASTLKNLKYFETIHVHDLKHHAVKRDLQEYDYPINKIEITFRTLGKDFRLSLTPKKGILHSNFKAYAVDGNGKETFIDFDHNKLYSGRVLGEVNSEASIHIDDEGVITGSVHLSDEIYHIEPSWRHLPHLDNKTMITYRESDIKLSCDDHVSPKIWELVEKEFEPKKVTKEETYNKWKHGIHHEKRQVHQYKYTPIKTRCPLLLVADYKFFQEMGANDTKTTINYLISLIDRVHKIFNDTIWYDRDELDGFGGMGFVIKKILVHSEPTQVQKEKHYNMVKEKWKIRDLLEVFSRESQNKYFCLAHLFTHQIFEMGIMGLSYVASSKRTSVGGICTLEYFKNGYNLHLNTGLTSSLNHYSRTVITQKADLLTAHEFGHSWGSEHDPDIPECSPNVTQGGSYLMCSCNISGHDVNNRYFSPCSLRSIHKVLLTKSDRCFSEPKENDCGNFHVEGDEECDAGLSSTEDNDPCCDGNCMLKRSQGAVCSDKNSLCCQNCQYVAKGLQCRKAEYATCKKEASCTGLHAECPESSSEPDGTNCQERGKCKGGKCITYCEIQGWQSCMCDIIENACKRCCRIRTNQTCFPIKPIHTLPDGTPCIQGFCNKGRCAKIIQNEVEEETFDDIIEYTETNKVYLFLKDNIVGLIILVTAVIWIPAGCVINYVDRKRMQECKEYH